MQTTTCPLCGHMFIGKCVHGHAAQNKYALGKQSTLAELCAKKDERIQELERAVSVLTGSNPDWRYNVSNGDVSIIDKILEKLNAWSE